MSEIPTASKRQITQLRKLQQKKYREEFGLYIAEGERVISQLLENSTDCIKELFIDPTFDRERFFQEQQKVNPEMIRVLPKDLLNELSDTNTPQGIIAICNIPEQLDLKKLQEETEGLILALDRIQDPGNMGTIIRTASWFGLDGLFIGKGCVDIFHPKVVRSTAGATGMIPYKYGELNTYLKEFEQNGWVIVLLALSDNAEKLPEFHPSPKTIVTIGNEANGIAKELFETHRKIVSIPGIKNKNVESLNAAVASGIALYDIFGKLILR